jgi:hypothetical protein
MQKTSINHLALIAFLTAILSVISFCIGITPIPLSDLLCYPVSFVFDVVSLVTGLTALRQIRSSAEPGRELALTGIWISSLTGIAMLCMVALTISMIPILVNFINKFWSQLHL